MKRFVLFALAAAAASTAACHGCAREGPDSCDWTQHGHDFTHGGSSCLPGQPLTRKLASFTFDPFVPQEVESNGGSLTVHYQTPIIVEDDLYMMVKSGTYVPCDPNNPAPCGSDTWDQQVWNEARFVWKDGQLTESWRFVSDWKPLPALLAGWEPVFQPAAYRDVLYVPGAGGTLHKLDRRSGRELALVNPFGGAVDPSTYVVGGLAVDGDGSIYYHALKIDPANPFNDTEGWLVKVTPDGKTKRASFDTLVPGAPAAADACNNVFSNSTPKPWPPPPDASGNPARPPQIRCGPQRPGLNVTPAIGLDGTVYTVSRANIARRYSYLVAVHPDLTPKWSTSLRDILSDGCGVIIPFNDPASANPNPNLCRAGATQGVDPNTNEKPAGIVENLSTSSPVALPDGSLLYGAYTGYNGSRGHLMHFSADGKPLGSYDFGWDITPAYYRHDGTYSIVVKDNHYGTGPYQITSLSPKLEREWSFTSPNTKTCTEDGDGGLTCVDNEPRGFEWCFNAPAVDSEGTIFVNSEDGFIYSIGKDGKERQHFFLNTALGAAYTPVALDSQGRIYALYGGVMTVIGK